MMKNTGIVFSIMVMCVMSVACIGTCAAAADSESVMVVDKLELQQVLPKVALDKDRVIMAGPDGKKEIPVALETSKYELTVLRTEDNVSNKEKARKVYCITVLSRDEAVPYSWSCWLDRPFGGFQIVKDSSDKYYLAWAVGADLWFADVSRANDKTSRLNEFLSTNGVYPDVVQVPVRDLVPEALKWGVNAHYSDIRVRSISKSADGKWSVKVSGPDSEDEYTIVSNLEKSLQRDDWCLE